MHIAEQESNCCASGLGAAHLGIYATAHKLKGKYLLHYKRNLGEKNILFLYSLMNGFLTKYVELRYNLLFIANDITKHIAYIN